MDETTLQLWLSGAPPFTGLATPKSPTIHLWEALAIRDLRGLWRGAGYEAPYLMPSPAPGCHGNDPASCSGSS
ncbi:hypothetical protein Q8A67_018921 [Cirrhinus molitorella]|uniref:Uncharacterized protein n=1 Tax=Cirrhinus molitorella TaxID=172907 RepID=A0AA88THW2_9TELE|nr:hypothetical protein Q8A67_018921 [Cirrhinus molitorella]